MIPSIQLNFGVISFKQWFPTTNQVPSETKRARYTFKKYIYIFFEEPFVFTLLETGHCHLTKHHKAAAGRGYI